MHTISKKLFIPNSNHWKKRVAMKQWIHFSQFHKPCEISLFSEIDTFSPITFGKLNSFISSHFLPSAHMNAQHPARRQMAQPTGLDENMHALRAQKAKVCRGLQLYLFIFNNWTNHQLSHEWAICHTSMDRNLCHFGMFAEINDAVLQSRSSPDFHLETWTKYHHNKSLTKTIFKLLYTLKKKPKQTKKTFPK